MPGPVAKPAVTRIIVTVVENDGTVSSAILTPSVLKPSGSSNIETNGLSEAGSQVVDAIVQSRPFGH